MKRLIPISLLFLAGCAATTFYTVQIPMPRQMENTDIVAAAVSTFQDNGFTITLANEKICTVTTDAKTMDLSGGQAFSKVMFGVSEVRTIRLSLSGNAQNKIIKINPVVQQVHDSHRGAGAPSSVTPDERELNLIRKISEELAAKLNIQSSQIEITSYEEGA